MSQIHINHIKTYLEKNFKEYVDMSDYEDRPFQEKNKCFLSRSLAAYSLVILSQCSIQDASASITDGFDDNGIDCVYYDKKENKLWFVQSKFIEGGNGSISNGDLLKFIEGIKEMLSLSFDSSNEKINSHAEEIEEALNDYKVKINIVIATTGKKVSRDNLKKINKYLKELNDPTPIAFYHDFNLEVAHEGLSERVEGDPIDEDVELCGWGMVDTPYKAVYGLIDGIALAEWWKKYRRKLFSDNIRSFMGVSSDVNDNISQTIMNAPENFVYFNNGVTILCEKIIKKPIGGQNKSTGVFHCKNISVVNGAQTIGTIGSLLEDNALEGKEFQVMVKLISLEHAPEGFGNQITIAANTQNRVERKDFVSLELQQHRLRNEFALEGLYYHIKRSDEKLISDEKNYTLEEATLSLATFSDDVSLSVLAKREIGRLWDNTSKSPYSDLFNPNLSVCKLKKTITVYRAVSDELRTKSAQCKGREKSIYVYGNLFIVHMVFRLIPSYMINSDTCNFDVFFEGIVKKEIPNIINLVYSTTMALYPNAMCLQLFRNYTKCRDIKSKMNISPMKVEG